MRFSTLVFTLFGVLFCTSFVLGPAAVLATDWQWFQEVGYGESFRTTLIARFGVGSIVALTALASLQANAIVALRTSNGTRRPRLIRELATTPMGTWLGHLSRRQALTMASTVLAVLFGVAYANSWDELLLGLHGGAFGTSDPIFGYDVSFYVFTLPALHVGREMALALTLLTTLYVTTVYTIFGEIELDPYSPTGTRRPLTLSPVARRHLGVIGVFVSLWLALGVWLARYEQLFDPSGLLTGVTRTDHALTLPLLAAQTVGVFVGGVLLSTALHRRSRAMVAPAVGLLAMVGLLGGLLPSLYHSYVVLPDELDLERPYIEHHIAATRQAFGLSAIEERYLSGEAGLTMANIEANRGTVENIRLWEHAPLLDAFSQVQEIRTYYEFPSVDIDRYVVDGRLRQTMVSARELNSENLPPRARTWVNEAMIYTHGYGVALGPVNRVTPEGLPELWIQDLPPRVRHDEVLHIDQPALYYGESMTRPVFVRTGTPEFDYPTGDQHALTEYRGKGGVPLGGPLWKVLWSIRLRNAKVLLSNDLHADSRVMIHRSIPERVSRIAPFLVQDGDPYLVIADGRLVWMLDTYTTSSRFPYAQEVGGANYVRNSVKVTIDAYDGTLSFWVFDPTDPILQAWRSIYPSMFHPASELSPALRAHVRYPEDLFQIQAQLFASYHMTDPQVFYNREDEWEIPTVGDHPMRPYYTVMRLPEETHEEFILMLPFVPRGKPNLATWMVARSDTPKYGKILAYKFPKDRMVYGPSMIVARFNQDAPISEKLSLWNQRGSQVILGSLVVVPIDESLIYVQPLYLQAERGSIPELKRVLVGYQEKIAMGTTLEEALEAIFGARSTPSAPNRDEPSSELGERALTLYEKAVEAARAGEWAAYGEAIDTLGQTLEILVRGEGEDTGEVP